MRQHVSRACRRSIIERFNKRSLSAAPRNPERSCVKVPAASHREYCPGINHPAPNRLQDADRERIRRVNAVRLVLRQTHKQRVERSRLHIETPRQDCAIRFSDWRQNGVGTDSDYSSSGGRALIDNACPAQATKNPPQPQTLEQHVTHHLPLPMIVAAFAQGRTTTPDEFRCHRSVHTQRGCSHAVGSATTGYVNTGSCERRAALHRTRGSCASAQEGGPDWRKSPQTARVCQARPIRQTRSRIVAVRETNPYRTA